MKILICGDFAPRHRVLQMINNNDYSFFSQVKQYTAMVDYSLINLEAPIVKQSFCSPIVKTGPNLKSPQNTIEAIKYVGFNCVTLANNHFRDYGQLGVEDTLTSCEQCSIDTVGGGNDLKQAQKILYKRIGNKTVAFINACEHEWSIATKNYGGSNPINPISMYYSIDESKNNADYSIVIVHGGIEQYPLPTKRMLELYRFFVDCGADVVVNHHQHCYSGYEIYRNRPIFYGLGNFSFDNYNGKTDKEWESGFALLLNIDNNISFELLPYTQGTKEFCGVSFLKDISDFEQSIKKLNCIICNNALLEKEYNILIEQSMSSYLSLLSPYSNKYLRALGRRNILPQFITQCRIKYFLANIKCESHRDRLIHVLQKKLK